MMFSYIIKPIIHRYNHAAKTTALYPLNAHGGSANYSAVMFIYIIIIHAPRNAYCFYPQRFTPSAFPSPPAHPGTGTEPALLLTQTTSESRPTVIISILYIYNILQYINIQIKSNAAAKAIFRPQTASTERSICLMQNKIRRRIYTMCCAAVMTAALLCVSAQLSIPLGSVPSLFSCWYACCALFVSRARGAAIVFIYRPRAFRSARLCRRRSRPRLRSAPQLRLCSGHGAARSASFPFGRTPERFRYAAHTAARFFYALPHRLYIPLPALPICIRCLT